MGNLEKLKNEYGIPVRVVRLLEEEKSLYGLTEQEKLEWDEPALGLHSVVRGADNLLVVRSIREENLKLVIKFLDIEELWWVEGGL